MPCGSENERRATAPWNDVGTLLRQTCGHGGGHCEVVIYEDTRYISLPPSPPPPTMACRCERETDETCARATLSGQEQCR